jgi:hypothetical protein
MPKGSALASARKAVGPAVVTQRNCGGDIRRIVVAAPATSRAQQSQQAKLDDTLLEPTGYFSHCFAPPARYVPCLKRQRHQDRYLIARELRYRVVAEQRRRS